MIRKNYTRIILALALLTGIISCNEELNTSLQLESNSKTIMVYLKGNPSYSILTKALENSKLAETLNLYGTITLFAPTDDAFKKYFQRKGISDISGVTENELKDLLHYHIYNKSYSSAFFTTGSLGTTTVEGDFIRMDISKGVRNTILNGTVKVDSIDIQVSNGVVHVIDDVLEPPSKTIYGWLKTQPNYSIMLEAFEKTGLHKSIIDSMVYDTRVMNFGKPMVKWRTLFLETNDVLKSASINSFDDLARKYSNTYNTTKSYTNPEDSLNLFVRYHCIEKRYFVSDVKNDYIETFKKGGFLIFNTSPEITINKHTQKDLVFNPQTGKNDTVTTFPKVTLAIDKSNNVSKNGIIHSVGSVLNIYDPPAVTLIQLFAGDPDDRNVTLPNGETKNVTDLFNEINNDTVSQSAVWWLKWGGSMTGTITSAWPSNTFNDYSVVVSNNSGGYWIELTTKPVFKGTYKVWVSYRRTNNTNYFVQFYWDDKKMGDLTDMTKSPDAFGNALKGTDTRVDRQVGVVKLTEMASHKFKLYLPNPGTSYTAWYTLELRPI